MRIRMEDALEEARHKFALYAEIMNGLSPLKKLSQGYSYVQGKDGLALKSVRQTNQGEEISIYVTDGVLSAVVTGKKEEQVWAETAK